MCLLGVRTCRCQNENPVYPIFCDEMTNRMWFPYLRIDESIDEIDENDEHTFWWIFLHISRVGFGAYTAGYAMSVTFDLTVQGTVR